MLAEENEYEAFLNNLNSFKGIEQVRCPSSERVLRRSLFVGFNQRFPRDEYSGNGHYRTWTITERDRSDQQVDPSLWSRLKL